MASKRCKNNGLAKQQKQQQKKELPTIPFKFEEVKSLVSGAASGDLL